jgi:hypothetical protein
LALARAGAYDLIVASFDADVSRGLGREGDSRDRG